MQISEISKNISKTERRDMMSIAELQIHHPRLNWYLFITGVLYPAEIFTYDDELVVQYPETLTKVEYLIQKTPKR